MAVEICWLLRARYHRNEWVIVSLVTNYLISEELNYTPQAIVVVINTLLIGIVLIAIGLIALYIGSIHTEVINRPLYIVREILESGVSRSEDIKRPSLE